MVKATISALVALCLAGSALSHGTTYSPAELAKRAEVQTIARRSLAGCQSKLRARGGVVERSMARRAALAEKARRDLGLRTEAPYLRRRDVDSVTSTSHASNETGLTSDSNPFDGNSSCVLAPEVTQGPYYVDGELIRQDLTDGQEGVPLYADIELIDITTCEPVSDIYIDFWHANATGVYSGVVASGNGVGSEDSSNINNTFLRGIQQTSDEGYAQFISIFPGHYTGRATHIHILAHQTDGTLNDNSTYSGSTVTHVGQVFFDQDLITTVEENSPYSTNTQETTENTEDSILEEEADDIDPFMEYVLLGDSVTDGILAWASIGINTSATYDVSPAAYWSADGGYTNADSDIGGGGGMGGGEGGAAPSGGMPSGSDASAVPSASSAEASASSTSSSALQVDASSGIFTSLLMLTLGIFSTACV